MRVPNKLFIVAELFVKLSKANKKYWIILHLRVTRRRGFSLGRAKIIVSGSKKSSFASAGRICMMEERKRRAEAAKGTRALMSRIRSVSCAG